jgi:hypothetical protein
MIAEKINPSDKNNILRLNFIHISNKRFDISIKDVKTYFYKKKKKKKKALFKNVKKNTTLSIDFYSFLQY